MATRPDYVKIGLFVLLGLGAAVALAIAVGATTLHKRTISYTTYFNEAVTGLEVGAPVKTRGVTAGQVGYITIAPDHRMVEVRCDLDIGELEHLGLREPGLPATQSTVPPDVRAQLMSQGLTGTRLIGLDFFDPKENPPPHLTFPPPERYIPAARSVQRNLEESATKAMEGLADIVGSLEQDRFGEKLLETIRRADDALDALDRILGNVNGEKLAVRGAATLDELRLAARNVREVLEHLDGRTGLVATAQRSIDSLGDVGRSATGATRNLDETLVEIREAAGAIRLLAEELERDPDMLVKGRAKEKAQ